MIVTLEMSERAFALLAGLNRSMVHRMLQKGDLNQLRTKSEPKVNQTLNASVLKISLEDSENEPRANQERTKSEPNKRKERENEEREETKDFFPQTPFIENKKEKKEKDKEKENFFPPKPPEGRREKAEAEERSGGVRREIFYAPTIGEVQSYIDLKGYLTDAEEFVAFYESKGWMVGKNKMKNWRMALVTWEKQRKRKSIENIYGNDRRDTWGKRGATPVVATSAKDYEGRF